MDKCLDLASVLPEEMFIEIDQGPSVELSFVNVSFYKSDVGTFSLTLYADQESTYYVQKAVSEPIGDYGTNLVTTWFECIDNLKLKHILGGCKDA